VTGPTRAVRLGEICTVTKGVSYAGRHLGGEGPRMIGMGNIAPGRGVALDGARNYSGKVRPDQVVEDGDVAVALTDLTQDGRLLGAPARLMPSVHGPLVVSHHLATVRPSPAVESRFLYYVLNSPAWRQHVWSMATGTTVRAVSIADAADYAFVLPDAAARRRAVELLGALDDKIESNHRQAELGEQLLDALAATVLDRIRTPLGELVEVDRETCAPPKLGEATLDHFSLPAFDATRRPDRTAASSIKSNKLVVAAESILLSRLNPATNRTWFAVPSAGIPAVASTEFMVIRPADGLGLGALWLALRSDDLRAELAARATGTSGSHQRVRPADVLSIEVPDVRGLDTGLVDEAEALLRLVHQARAQSEVLGEVRETALPQLVTRSSAGS
jgi:type I restriction enzyme S subunit